MLRLVVILQGYVCTVAHVHPYCTCTHVSAHAHMSTCTCTLWPPAHLGKHTHTHTRLLPQHSLASIFKGMVLLHLLTGHLLLLLVVDQVTSQSAPPPNTTSCYSTSCGDDPTIPWCVQTCPSNLTKCLTLYSTDLLTGVATPIAFRCAYSPAGGCMSWSCDPASISEVGVSSCCCTGELCNYVSMVMAAPLPGEGVW